jgi:uncharacterized protein (TIGR02301 family)
MKLRIYITSSCVALAALGSAVALAQAVPQEAATEATPAIVAEPAPSSSAPPEAPASTPQSAPDSSPVEDAPIDVPNDSQADWAPDINLDAQRQADTATSSPQPKARPRKILSDAGENALGSGSWSQGSNSENAQAALLARTNRRERKVDPVKRSDLTKLARVMGALHALRVSCSGRDDQTYRSRMATMLDLEAPDSGELRDPLVDAFNGGFQVYGRGASTCPSDARAQEASLAKEGYVVARSMSARYRPQAVVAAALPPATQPRVNSVPAPIPTPVPASSRAEPTPSVKASPPASHAQARPSWGTATPN